MDYVFEVPEGFRTLDLLWIDLPAIRLEGRFMSDRQSIIGFTEAELGLFVVFFVLMLGPKATPTENGDAVSVPRSELDSLRATASRVPDLEDQVAQLQVTNDSLSGLRSSLTPPCKEKKGTFPRRFLLEDVVVEGPDSFSVAGRSLTLDKLLARVDEQLRKARRIDCTHEITVRQGLEVDRKVFYRAQRALRRDFYVHILEPQ
jgi:hypothetical protein